MTQRLFAALRTTVGGARTSASRARVDLRAARDPQSKVSGGSVSGSRSIFTKGGPGAGNSGSWLTLSGGICGLLIAGTVGLAVYAGGFGAGSVYPKAVRDLLREGGTA
ncbi:hypothetical protein EV175_007663, partial [Coemansia sp. RSA 1933]